MPLNVIFMYGFLGAFAVDFQAFYDEVNKLHPQMVGVPAKFTRTSYWLIRLVHAFVGGFLAVAGAETYPTLHPLLLVGIGASSRVIVQKFGRLVAEGLK